MSRLLAQFRRQTKGCFGLRADPQHRAGEGRIRAVTAVRADLPPVRMEAPSALHSIAVRNACTSDVEPRSSSSAARVTSKPPPSVLVTANPWGAARPRSERVKDRWVS